MQGLDIVLIPGLAHMLEHEAFKGTRRVGTLDWQKERPLLEAQDEGKSNCQHIDRCASKRNLKKGKIDGLL